MFFSRSHSDFKVMLNPSLAPSEYSDSVSACRALNGLKQMITSALNLLFVSDQDEVLAVSRKMVVRVEDLVRWSCVQPAGWSSSLKALACGTNGLHKPPQSGDGSNGTTDKSSEPLKDKTESKKLSADVCRCEPEPVCWCGNAAGHTPVHVPASLLELLLFWKVSSEAAKAALKEQNHWNHLMDSVLWSFPTHHYKRSKDVHREKA